MVEVSRGFPVVQAEVEHDAQGYGAVLAWIQVVHMFDLDTGESSAPVDLAPQLAGLDLPYLSFGVRPILFDAPSTTSRNVDWDADAFLVVTPDGLMTRRIQPLVGFSWGYGFVTASRAPFHSKGPAAPPGRATETSWPTSIRRGPSRTPLTRPHGDSRTPDGRLARRPPTST
ncbi:MAG: hypothetical protein H0T66_16700 [Geodermatophilaceae bacterium]|nr:hypothetical protein [Geodermatophilaceae bacterium]